MNVTRVKYRDVLDVEGGNVQNGGYLSMLKKLPKQEARVHHEEIAFDAEQPPLIPEATQLQTFEAVITSNEKKHRDLVNPCIDVRIKEHDTFVKRKQQDRQLKRAIRDSKRRWERLLKNPKYKNDPVAFAEASQKLAQREHAVTSTDTHGALLVEDFDEEYKKKAMDAKELKLLALRKPQSAHLPPPRLIQKIIAFRNSLGCLLHMNPMSIFHAVGGDEHAIASNPKRKISEILPWMFIGHFEAGCDMELLIKLNITHIINVTEEIENVHLAHFVYMKIPIADSVDADMYQYFPEIEEFLDRIVRKRGKVLIHCKSGVSRAPTVAIAYIMKSRNISLLDCFEYVKLKRDIIHPNAGFMYQLAKYEVEQGFGTSVRYRLEWMNNYDYNRYIKLETRQYKNRSSKGLFFTTLDLFQKPRFFTNPLGLGKNHS